MCGSADVTKESNPITNKRERIQSLNLKWETFPLIVWDKDIICSSSTFPSTVIGLGSDEGKTRTPELC